MPFFPKRSFFSKATQGYQSVQNPSGRSSSDDILSSDVGLLEKEIEAQRRRNSFWRRYALILALNLVIFVLYLLILGGVVSYSQSQALKGPGLIFSPAQEAVQWEERRFIENSQEHGPFSGFPRDEIDQNWHDLLNAENIMLEPEVMRHYGREDLGVAIPEGGGYIGTLNVYHELHCIKRLYQYSYQDHYWSDLTDEQREVNRLHNEHCLDFLRQASMCHADIGIITFQWSSTSLIPVANATSHECKNWKKINEWTKARTVDMMKPGWLVHPMKGPAYPVGEGSRLGAMKATKGGEEPHLVGTHEGHEHEGM